MDTQDSLPNSPSKAVWVVDEGAACGATRRLFLRKETREAETNQDPPKTDIYARFATIFRSPEDTPAQQHKDKRLSVLDECEEDVESGRRDTMCEEDWEDKLRHNVGGKQRLEQGFQPCGQEIPTRRSSWKTRFSKSNLRINTSLGQTQNHDIPVQDKIIVKTVSHTATLEDEPLLSHEYGREDLRDTSIGETTAITPLDTSLELERERIQRLFEHDLHQKRLELRRMRPGKRASPEYSHLLHILNDTGLRRMAGGVECRMRTMNAKITALLVKHSRRVGL